MGKRIKGTIGITGANGFIAWHLINTLRYIHKQDCYVLITKEDFQEIGTLFEKVAKCDVIVHFAAVNRSTDERLLLRSNKKIIDDLIDCMHKLDKYPRFINISSIHEVQDSAFGMSKRYSRRSLERYYHQFPEQLTTIIAPNIFGAFCKPNYNSVVATFCHSLITGNALNVNGASRIRLVYVDDLVDIIISTLSNERAIFTQHDFQGVDISIRELADKLKYFHSSYFINGHFPRILSRFDIDLFNTYRSYIPLEKCLFGNVFHSDNRGYFTELVRSHGESQFSLSRTVPGITRGNHFHRRKIERFIVLNGEAEITLRRVDSGAATSFKLTTNTRLMLDIPIWYTHNVTNTSPNVDLEMLFWINEWYNDNDSDTYILTV